MNNSRKGITVLYDNEESEQRFVIAHELGHVILHPNLNTPFLRKNTLLSVDGIEREANEFAVELLISDKLLLEGVTIYEAAAACGVPEEVAHLKSRPEGMKKSIQEFWAKEEFYFSL